MTDVWTTADIHSRPAGFAIVTGATIGLGLECARALAIEGAEVVIAARDMIKAARVTTDIHQTHPHADVECRRLDTARLACVRDFADRWQQQGRGTDLLLLNAGISNVPTRELTPDGFERQFATTYLDHFALAGLLLPQVIRAPGSRIVTVCSLQHRNVQLGLDDLQLTNDYTPTRGYAQSKLAILTFAVELDRRLRDANSPIAPIAAHPGFAATGIVRAGDRASPFRRSLANTISGSSANLRPKAHCPCCSPPPPLKRNEAPTTPPTAEENGAVRPPRPGSPHTPKTRIKPRDFGRSPSRNPGPPTNSERASRAAASRGFEARLSGKGVVFRRGRNPVGMGARFIGVDREQVFLMPPSVRDWVPEDHLVWTVLDAASELDLSAFYAVYRADGHGRPAYEPSMMVALLMYAYARGNRSSRRIERRAWRTWGIAWWRATWCPITRRSRTSAASTSMRWVRCSRACLGCARRLVWRRSGWCRSMARRCRRTRR
jgi:NAD(P)-dependent dehydrogenase (short-subunit alcohol dehydrogenase family)